jgi:hypothetical protein
LTAADGDERRTPRAGARRPPAFASTTVGISADLNGLSLAERQVDIAGDKRRPVGALEIARGEPARRLNHAAPARHSLNDEGNMTSTRKQQSLALVSLIALGCAPVTGLVSAKMAGSGRSSRSDQHKIDFVVRDLDEMEQGAQGDQNHNQLARFGDLSQSVGQQLFYSDDAAIKNSSKLKSLQERYLAINRQLAQRAGGHALEVMGDAVPPKKVTDSDGARVADEAVGACHAAKPRPGYNSANDQKEVTARYATYEEKLARAKRVDEAALKYRAGAIAACELEVAMLRSGSDDVYSGDKPVIATDHGCGEKWFSVRAVMLGTTPGIYEPVMGSETHPQKIDCKKIPSSSKFPKEFKQAVDDFLQGEGTKTGAIRFDGKFYTDTDKADLHVYKYAALSYSAKDMSFEANRCGGTDPKLACEASESKTARALNEIEFYSARADVRRKQGDADACKRLLRTANTTYESWSKEYDRLQSNGKWVKGLKYKTHRGETLNEEQIVSRIKTLGKAADDQALGGWCRKAG